MRAGCIARGRKPLTPYTAFDKQLRPRTDSAPLRQNDKPGNNSPAPTALPEMGAERSTMDADYIRGIIREYKARTGKSLRHIARNSGVAQSTVYNYMHGTRNLSYELTEQILNALGLELYVRRKKD